MLLSQYRQPNGSSAPPGRSQWHFAKLLFVFLGISRAASTAVLAATITYTDLHPADAVRSCARAVNASQQAGEIGFVGQTHAVLWSGSSASMIDLHPSGAASSQVNGISDSTQAGFYTVEKNRPRAVLWSGTAASALTLQPAGATESWIGGATSSCQAGTATIMAQTHAALWSGTANSYVDLHPSQDSIDGASMAFAASGSQQVGFVESDEFELSMHAALWSGTAASYVDLHPAGAFEGMDSIAYATSGSQQGGIVSNHAALWSGTAASFVDLGLGRVEAMSGSKQAGMIFINNGYHAALWSGTAASRIDLHTVLGSTFPNSGALGIWTDGKTTYVAGWAGSGRDDYGTHAILWTIRGEDPAPGLPKMTVTHAEYYGGTMVLKLTWKKTESPCVLEQASKLPSGWSQVIEAWTTNGDWITVDVPSTDSAQFYRLRGN